jgi:hypothetical protein
MNNNDYQEMPCISSHWLKDVLDSPATCYRNHLDPLRPVPKASNAMKLGTLVHGLALTPLQFGEDFIIDAGHRRRKAGKVRHDAPSAPGLTVVHPAEFERAQMIVAALKAHPDARRWLAGGQKEKTVIQERERGLLPLKARLDVHHEARRHVVELKTIHGIEAIEQAFHQYRYALSAAFYAAISESLSVHFIFVETGEPYEVAVFEMSGLQLQEGREQWQSALRTFDDCWRRHEWPEAEPVAAADDPLMMNFLPPKATTVRPRLTLPLGELTL